MPNLAFRSPRTIAQPVEVFQLSGTVEDTVTIKNFRVTPGFELRINIPALGPVPLAVGFGIPVSHAPFDDIRNFHFFVGLSR